MKYKQIVTFKPGGNDQVTESGGAAHALRVAIIMGTLDTTGKHGGNLDGVNNEEVALNDHDGVFTLVGYAHTIKNPLVYKPVKATNDFEIVLPPDVDVSKAPHAKGRITKKQVLVNGVLETRNVYEVKTGKPIPADLIVYADRGKLENAGYNVKENGIPICHSHLGLKNTGVDGMIANPVILGKLMHEIVQKHLLNKNHFSYKEYVEKCTDAFDRILRQEELDLAIKRAMAVQGEAALGEGQFVTPATIADCHKYDVKRIHEIVDRHSDSAEALLYSQEAHLRTLGVGIHNALDTLHQTLHSLVGGGYQVKDFLVNGDELNSSFPNPPQSPHIQAVGNVQTQAQHGLKNPYTFLSQEFLRHRLIEDFEGTMARHQNGSTMIKGMSALAKDSTSDKATKAMLTRLHELNDAAAGAVLHHIQPGQYDRHVRLAKLHEAALSILGSTHAAGLPKQPQGSPPPALTKEQAELDRAKVKIAYHLMKGLDDNVLMQIVNYKVKQKDRPAEQAQIDAAKDAHLATVQKLHDAYQAAASDPAQIKALAATLPDPPKPPKKPKPKP
jgi:hypothetical protein